MKTSPRSWLGKLAVTYVLTIHCLLFLVLWKSDFIPNVKTRLSAPFQSAQNQEGIQQPRYETLLAHFPEDNQGTGADEYGTTSSSQPMTYGLILSAESMRFDSFPTAEGKRRIRKAFTWLLDNSDLDADGRPGWGLPQVWDAFGDGTVNPSNHSYTVTTAICLNGLQDALRLDDFWSSSEKDAATQLLTDIAIRWCKECVSDGFEGKYFWYSVAQDDDYFCPNVSSMFMGSLVRLLNESPNLFSDDEQNFVSETISECADALIATAQMRYGAPFWKYVAEPNNLTSSKANDAVHHAYILWGIETFRDYCGNNSIPWNRDQSIESMDRYWSRDRCCEFPQDVKNSDEGARLWGTGMALALYAQFGETEKSDRILTCIAHDYRWPDLTHRPGEDSSFLPRAAAHVLFGMACRSFTPVADNRIEGTVGDHQRTQTAAAIPDHHGSSRSEPLH